MVEMTSERDRFNWMLPLYSAIGALILFIPIMIYGIDMEQMLYIFAVVPVVSLVLLVIAILFACRKKRLKSLAVFLMLVIYCSISWGLFKYSRELQSATRWGLLSKGYKAKVLAQPNPSNGELKHIEWDGWGWGGNDTVEYLVFDPNNSLTTAAKDHLSGKFGGIPCEVRLVRRLENHWYTVLFYTDETWNNWVVTRSNLVTTNNCT